MIFKTSISILSLWLISIVGLSQEYHLSIEEIEEIVSSKESSDVYELLMQKDIKLIDYNESDLCRGTWEYAYKHDKLREVAEMWVSYDCYDLEKMIDKFNWNENWFLEKYTSGMPNVFYSYVDMEFIWFDSENYREITEFIKSNYEKDDVGFDESLKTYVYLFKNGDFQYNFYETSDRCRLQCTYFDRNKSALIERYRNKEKTYREDVRRKWEKEGHTVCECTVKGYDEMTPNDSLYWYCSSLFWSKHSTSRTGASYEEIDRFFMSECDNLK